MGISAKVAAEYRAGIAAAKEDFKFVMDGKVPPRREMSKRSHDAWLRKFMDLGSNYVTGRLSGKIRKNGFH